MHQRRMRREGRFPAYRQRLHGRLARHGFERSFQLNEEPDRQDKLATWIEFLDFEYLNYDKSADFVSRWQSQYDEAWKTLVDSKVLKPFETGESFDYFFWLQQQNEKILAKKTVETATSAVKSAEKVLLKRLSASLSAQCLSRMEQKLSAARSKLIVAMKSLEQFIRRDKLISDFNQKTKSYAIAKDDVASQSRLLRWILQQVPLIELELKLAKVTENDSITSANPAKNQFRSGRNKTVRTTNS